MKKILVLLGCLFSLVSFAGKPPSTPVPHYCYYGCVYYGINLENFPGGGILIREIERRNLIQLQKQLLRNPRDTKVRETEMVLHWCDDFMGFYPNVPYCPNGWKVYVVK